MEEIVHNCQTTPIIEANFQAKMDALRGILLGAQGNMDIWAALSTSEALEQLNPMSPYFAFFLWTRNTHADFTYVRLFIATAPRRKRTEPSIFEVAHMVDECPSLAQGVDTKKALRPVADQKATIDKVHRFRHQAVAHYEIGANAPPVSYEECAPLLAALEAAFNDVHQAWKPGKTWSFKPAQSPSNQTGRLVTDLQKFWKGEPPYPNFRM